MSKCVGVSIAAAGAAIVHVDHGDDEALVCTAIERVGFDLSAVANRVTELDAELAEVRFVIDAEALGGALWQALGPPEDAERWQLYAGRGIERQALVDGLLVAIHEGRFHFAPNLVEQAAMSKAIVSYRREVREDGVIGSELVVALLLALTPAPPVPTVAFFFGRPRAGPSFHPFGVGYPVDPAPFTRKEAP